MENNNLIHKLDAKPASGSFTYLQFFIFVAVAVIVGTLVGFGLNKLKKSNSQDNISLAKAEKTVGIADKKTFKDKAEGTLKEGGIDGEGNFHLVRPGGVSQNVYLTSTTVDLSQYIGKKVRVWGETFSAEKAGWLMDVGLVEILK
ncbi:hypothetical protein HZA76_03205 [Candidatus Roizmanbacteria bacterium]|nr:hypothetical protein [Candidatus Roizmanbacteria bacterium]